MWWKENEQDNNIDDNNEVENKSRKEIIHV